VTWPSKAHRRIVHARAPRPWSRPEMKVLKIVSVIVLFVFACLVVLAGYVAYNMRMGPLIEETTESLFEKRARHSAKIAPNVRPPASPSWQEAPNGMRDVHVPSGGLTIAAWVSDQAFVEGAKAPTLVYLHGGFALDRSDYEITVRAEMANPGSFELLWGELDDVAALIRWLSNRPGVDARNIFVLGHSVGGGLAGLVSLVDDLPVRLTASIGGLYPETVFLDWSFAPFDVLDRDARRLRVLHPHVKSMRRPHIAFVGDADLQLLEFALAMQEKLGNRDLLSIQVVKGDHQGSIVEGVQRFLELAQNTP